MILLNHEMRILEGTSRREDLNTQITRALGLGTTMVLARRGTGLVVRERSTLRNWGRVQSMVRMDSMLTIEVEIGGVAAAWLGWSPKERKTVRVRISLVTVPTRREGLDPRLIE